MHIILTDFSTYDMYGSQVCHELMNTAVDLYATSSAIRMAPAWHAAWMYCHWAAHVLCSLVALSWPDPGLSGYPNGCHMALPLFDV